MGAVKNVPLRGVLKGLQLNCLKLKTPTGFENLNFSIFLFILLYKYPNNLY